MEDELSHQQKASANIPSTMRGACKDSRTITKPRPGRAATSKLQSSAIRIIHVFAPEIIKTDPANFRELVQKLTGKPVNCSKSTRKPAKKQQSDLISETPTSSSSSTAAAVLPAKDVKGEEEEISWGLDNSSFSNGLPDIDSFLASFIQMGSSDLSEFPLLPIETNHHMF